MSDQQILQFIFRPGFSTAAKVTNVSGRGVGLDVVRTNIEKIGGTVELKSQEGKFTAFTIKIPLTLAIVSALIVACDEQRFAIPQLNVCPSSKQMGLLSVFHKGGSGSSLFDVKPLGFDGSSGGFGWSVF